MAPISREGVRRAKAAKWRMRACLSMPLWSKGGMKKGHRPSRPKGGGSAAHPRFWGRHAVSAALDNPERTIRKIWATRDAANALDILGNIPVTFCDGADLGRMIPGDAPHQGVVADVDPLDSPYLGDLLLEGAGTKRPLVVLDQVTDPHNIGAILRSAAAFDAIGIVTQDRNSPPESGTIAKSASGALEIVPWVRVVNLARALDEIAEAGFWRIGLDGEVDQALGDVIGDSRVALVLGAEGEGLRHNTVQHCDMIAKLPMSGKMESLNVSNAAAIALYAVATAR